MEPRTVAEAIEQLDWYFTSDDGSAAENETKAAYAVIKQTVNDIVNLLWEQKPRVLTMSEVERIGANNHSAFNNDGLTVMWLEEFGKQYPLHVVILKWDEDDWNGDPNNFVDVYYFGTDEYDRFGLTDYNLTWRCWTDKPTELQRMAVKWYA